MDDKEFFGSSQYQAKRDIRVSDGRNIQTGYQSGTQIGTDAKQKIGFFGATPISKPSVTPTTLAEVITLLKALGLTD